MLYIDINSKDAAYHFSVEEFCMRELKSEKPVLMIWQADNTVMLGNNQVVVAEVKLDYAQERGIKIVRRSSGGGAIYTDMGTVLYTLIQPINDDVIVHREEVAAAVIGVLGVMGVAAERIGKNDILIDGKKISGLAQYTTGNFVCTHGSLLYDTDLEVLSSVLVPNDDKLHPKGIKSIRSRVTNIKPYMSNDLTIGEFINCLKEGLLSGKEFLEYYISKEEEIQIERFYNKKYANDEWIYWM